MKNFAILTVTVLCLLGSCAALRIEENGDSLVAKPIANCTCNGEFCACCKPVHIGSILSFQICANITYDLADHVIFIGLGINGQDIIVLPFNSSTQKCFVWNKVTICLSLAKLVETNTGECGCLAVTVNWQGFNFGPIPIGCFHLGEKCSSNEEEEEFFRQMIVS